MTARRIATQSRNGFFSSGASHETGAASSLLVSQLLPNRHASATTVVPISPAGTTNGTSLAETAGLSTELISSTRGTRTVQAPMTPTARAAAAFGYCLLYRANPIVTAVEEITPPRRPVRR